MVSSATLGIFVTISCLLTPAIAEDRLVSSNGISWVVPFGPDITVHAVAAAFNVVAPATIRSIEFWSFELNPPFQGYAGSVTWSIFRAGSNTDAPLTLLAEAQGVNPTRRPAGAQTPSPGFTGVLYSNVISISPLHLPSGRYLLSLKGGGADVSDFDGFLWVAAINPELRVSFTKRNTGWIASGLGLAFRLFGNFD